MPWRGSEVIPVMFVLEAFPGEFLPAEQFEIVGQVFP
jgi:hypothetical protein